ncbi:MAG: inositol monophosphatase family protein [candidate division Zixibacteria bacterium]|nr:inositol monophosphatase family protein [candidate division Zixibacteria bacterium]
MLTNRNLRLFLKFARETAVGAGNILIKKARMHNEVHFKGRVNLVTGADIASEKYIIRNIENKFPDHSLLAEEAAATDKGSEFKWVIDPLDGTTNYAHHFPFYAVSIALEYQGKIVLGVVYDPEREELFSAFRGGGSFLNRKRNRITSERELSHSLLGTGFPYDVGTSQENNLNNYTCFARVSRGIRRAGSAALDLCYVACGRLDGFWELKLSPWDTAAGIIIVEEAGGKVTDFEGKKFSIYDHYILASNGHIHRQMQRVLAGHCE